MKLLTSQKNILYDVIIAYGLSPSQFILTEKESTNYVNEIVTNISHKSSEFYFSFESRYDRRSILFSPGSDTYSVAHSVNSWNELEYHFQNWIGNLLNEINVENKWDRLEKEMKGINLNLKNEPDKFSAHEFEELKNKVLAIKQGLNKIGLLSEQVSIINEKLDHLTELAIDMNKFDWKSLFIGTILSVIIQLGVTQENAKSLWALIKQVFNNYFLP